VGNQTPALLGSGRPWDVAAAEHFARSRARGRQRVADADYAGGDLVLPLRDSAGTKLRRAVEDLRILAVSKLRSGR
jgi:hypothetical protein